VFALSATGLSVAALTAQSPLSLWLGTVALCLLLTSAGLVAAHRAVRLLPFNACSGAMLVLIILSAPLPPGTQMRLTLELQMWVTEWVVRSLDFMGLAAHRLGAVIELPNGQVGVDDACSGVRSLFSCVYAAIFLAAVLPRGRWACGLLIAVAAPCALALNYARSLVLTWLAAEGHDLSQWHDLTGYSVLLVGSVGLSGFAWLLAKREGPPGLFANKPTAILRGASVVEPAGAARGWLGLLAGAVLLVVAAVSLFVWGLRPAQTVDTAPSSARLETLLPETMPGWRTESNTELYRFASALRTENLLQRTYVSGPPERLVVVTVYLAAWPTGQVPVSLVASHTPDACWPGAGWAPAEGVPPAVELAIEDRTLTPAQQRVFLLGEAGRHVWFWHLADRRPVPYAKPASALSLMRLVVQQGVFRPQEQLFVRISSNAPWSLLAQEPLLAELVRRLGPEGLLPQAP
jgi:exosortase